MLATIFRNLWGAREDAPAPAPAPAEPLRLHIGGMQPHPDWRIVNVMPTPETDYVRSCTDLSSFADGSVAEIYASHVIEHLGYQSELPRALDEFFRVLRPDGTLRVSVPDLQTLCRLFIDDSLDLSARFHVMRIIYGGQVDRADFHYVGFDEGLLRAHLTRAGFTGIERVANFDLFEDTSKLVLYGTPISLNMIARKAPAGASGA